MYSTDPFHDLRLSLARIEAKQAVLQKEREYLMGKVESLKRSLTTWSSNEVR